jgi:Protein of unknown function (DUF1559)
MRRILVLAALAAAVLFLLAPIGLGLPLELAFYLVFGWIVYLVRVLPRVSMNASGIATAAVCLILLAFGGHAFSRWIHQQMRGVKQLGEVALLEPRWRWRWTGSLLGVVLLMFVAGMAVTGVAHQVGWLVATRPLTVSAVSGYSRRAHSTNNLKQIGLALHNYSQKHGSFPLAGTFDSIGRPLHGWQAAILPFVDQSDLYRRIDFRLPWNDTHNASTYQTEVYVYKNPGIEYLKDRAGYAPSHYAGSAAMLGGDCAHTLRDVTDATDATILAGEVASGFKPWGDPTNWREVALGINRAPNGFGGPFPGGASFLMVDGSVRFLKNTIDPNVLKALSTPAGGEKVSSEEY